MKTDRVEPPLRWAKMQRTEKGDVYCSLKRGRKTVLHLYSDDGVWRCYWNTSDLCFGRLPKSVKTTEAAKRASIRWLAKRAETRSAECQRVLTALATVETKAKTPAASRKEPPKSMVTLEDPGKGLTDCPNCQPRGAR